MSEYLRYCEMLLRGIAAGLGIPEAELITPKGMTLPEFAAEYERRVSIDGEAFWDADGFLDPDRVSAQSGSGNRHGV